jgi:hypothetical protein
VRPRVLALALALALAPGACLAEYVLPGTSDDGGPGDGEGDGPTSGGGGCGAGERVCGEACVDPLADDDHCGGCGEACKADERCILGECRDVVAVSCAACPCPGECPEPGPGAREDSGGPPAVARCCELADGVLCVTGDVGDMLRCPEGA